MGILAVMKENVLKWAFKEERPKIDAKCPKCGQKVDTSMERCPGCGTRISSMFRIKCPKCAEQNETSSGHCKKCGEPFAQREERAPSQQVFVCPRCGYRANYYMLSCPSCGVRFS